MIHLGLIKGDIWDRDFADIKITEENKKEIIENAQRYGGSVRMQMGLFYTDKEYNKFRERGLNTPLP